MHICVIKVLHQPDSPPLRLYVFLRVHDLHKLCYQERLCVRGRLYGLVLEKSGLDLPQDHHTLP